MATRAELLAEIRQQLRESSPSNWTDNELYSLMATTSREIVKHEGIRRRVNLAVIDNTLDIDVSSITDLFDIMLVEYPIGGGYYNPSFKNYEQFGSVIRLKMLTPQVSSAGTLTGTVTFTQNSRSVTGVGTKFTEITYGTDGYLIGKSSGTKYYQVAYVTDDNNLTLAEPFEETSGADTEDATKYRDTYSCARIIYSGMYTVDGTTCNLTNRVINAFILGVASKAATGFAGNYLQIKLTGLTTLLSTVSTTIGTATVRIQQAVTDIGTQRTNMGTYLSDFGSTIASVATRLAAATSDLTSGIALVNSVNIGKDVSENYVEYAKREIETAMGYLESAKSRPEAIKTADYINTAKSELEAAAQYLGQAASYINQAEQNINVSQLVSGYKSWANGLVQDYRAELATLGSVDDHVRPLGARE